jgi:hypothetical protein
MERQVRGLEDAKASAKVVLVIIICVVVILIATKSELLIRIRPFLLVTQPLRA